MMMYWIKMLCIPAGLNLTQNRCTRMSEWSLNQSGWPSVSMFLTKITHRAPHLCYPKQVSVCIMSLNENMPHSMRRTQSTPPGCIPSPLVPHNNIDTYSCKGLTLGTNHTKVCLHISNYPDLYSCLMQKLLILLWHAELRCSVAWTMKKALSQYWLSTYKLSVLCIQQTQMTAAHWLAETSLGQFVEYKADFQG